MIGNFFKRLDSPCESPYVIPCKRGNTPFVSDAVNLMAIGANQDIQEHTADKNYKMNQENNALQQQLAREANELSESQFQRNMNWLREQFTTNLQREDTKYQRAIADMQAAGVNPALAAGGVSSQVSSVGAPSPSSFHVAQTEAAHFDPYNLDFDPLASGIRDSVAAYFQNRKTEAETKNIETDSQTKAIENFTKLQRDIASYFNMLADTDKILADKDVAEETKSLVRQNRENAKQTYELLSKQFDDLAVQPGLQNNVLRAQEGDINESMNLKKAQQMAINAGIGLTLAQIGAVYQSIEESIARIKTDEKYYELSAAEVRNRVIGMIYDQADKFERLGMDKEMMASQKFKNYVGSVADGIGVGLGVYGASRGKRPKSVPSPIAPEFVETWSQYK